MADEIEQAKQAVRQQCFIKWRKEWMDNNQEAGESDAHIFARVPDPPEDICPKTWVVHVWNTGHLVMDADAYNKIPAAKRRKFEKSVKRCPYVRT